MTLAITCSQVQQWLQVLVIDICQGYAGYVPLEFEYLTNKIATPLEKELKGWWELGYFKYDYQNKLIHAAIHTIISVNVQNIFLLVILGRTVNNIMFVPQIHRNSAIPKQNGSWQMIDVNHCAFKNKQRYIGENTEVQTDNICLDAENATCHLVIYPDSDDVQITIHHLRDH